MNYDSWLTEFLEYEDDDGLTEEERQELKDLYEAWVIDQYEQTLDWCNMDGHEDEIEDIEIDESLAKQVANGLDYFWSQNELCYDENLKVVRSDRPRVRPKYSYDYVKRDKNDVEGNWVRDETMGT